MVRYDFGTIIDEVPKNLHFVRILGAEDVFDSHLLQFMKTLEMLGFVVITSVFRCFVVGEVSWVMGSIPLRSISLSGFAL